jgi:predicted AAA+ superfamily ATPase
MSFREYLLFDKGIDFPIVTLSNILENHLELAATINKQIRPLPLFQDYLKAGYYPYFKEDVELYHEKLMHTVNVILESDLPSVENIELYSIQKIKQLLYIISQRVPFTPNISELSSIIGVSRNSLLNYLTILQKAQLISLLSSSSTKLKTLAKPDKIYLNNPNLIYGFASDKPDIGNLRETFFYNQLQVVSSVTSSPKTDFIINENFHFEVGGKNKGHEQLMGLSNAYLALDILEYGYANKIPLWLFGFLY